jgi:hypothetical protein
MPALLDCILKDGYDQSSCHDGVEARRTALTFRVQEGGVSLPERMAGIVTGVFGLDERHGQNLILVALGGYTSGIV